VVTEPVDKFRDGVPNLRSPRQQARWMNASTSEKDADLAQDVPVSRVRSAPTPAPSGASALVRARRPGRSQLVGHGSKHLTPKTTARNTHHPSVRRLSARTSRLQRSSDHVNGESLTKSA
jgi:hypothetical protein